jgi:hypothetical protein
MTLVLAGALAVFIAGGQAVAAKRTTSGISNPDKNSYQSAAESCGGSASCYKAAKKKTK